MKLILAQGNPGAQYAATRHNVGFQALDMLASKQGATFSAKPKFLADIAEVSIAGEKVLLVKPTTFYNETGRTGRLLVDFYKLSPKDDLLVVHDDLALPLGTLRVREKGSDAGNNGIKSLSAHLGPDYPRLRIGIFSDLRNRMHDADFVLANFSKDEAEQLTRDILPKALELIDDFCHGQLQASSHSL